MCLILYLLLQILARSQVLAHPKRTENFDIMRDTVGGGGGNWLANPDDALKCCRHLYSSICSDSELRVMLVTNIC